MFNEKDQLAIDTIRALSIDAIEEANSGHPGLPMGAAPMAYTLWTRHLNFNPQSKDYFNRDRFILSAGHGSALLYSLLHVSGSLELEELKQFRQWGSKTPGHPEFRHTDGVEVTTGPLGQGFAMSVGMALAEAHLGGKFNKDDINVVDHYTYVLASDGDLMEGISHEAASFAGHNQLDKLIVLYDSNDISLDGELNKSFSEDVKQRFESYGWNHILVKDGNNLEEIDNAITKAKQQNGPTLIEVKTIIGYGAPNVSGTNGVHGAPLGTDERKLTFEAYGLDPEKRFNVPEEVYEIFQTTMLKRANEHEDEWKEKETYTEKYPELAEEFKLAISGKLPENYKDELPKFSSDHNAATRADSGEIIQAISKSVPSFFGGSADLAGSNKSNVKEATDYNPNTPEGKNVWFGVREFAMGAAVNGMAAHGGLHPYGATFFVFSDYLKPALRLSAIMGLNATFIFTHDSIAVGEDGPTHEPIEQLAGLRAIPNMNVIRPADGNETRVAWEVALESKQTPTSLVLTRQNLPYLDVDEETVEEGVRKGAYVVFETETKPEYLLLATGSEVSLAIEVAKDLDKQGKGVRVVSMPNWFAFEQQTDEYKESVIPKELTKRVAIEMASPLGWHKYVGTEGKVIGIDGFGASAPGDLVVEKYGFTKENILNQIRTFNIMI